MTTTLVKKSAILCLLCLVALGIMLSIFALSHVKPLPASFETVLRDSQFQQVLDRSGDPLNVTFQNEWNVHDIRALHDMPNFLKSAVVVSEDKRFFEHKGVDWWARMAAVKSNLLALRSVRGASTITEQSVRMLHPRGRTIGSRWIEGFEANELERKFTKNEILEFYLNQVPYAANRRGVAQAAYYYFDRDLDTLSQKEILALIVLVRAPSRMDLWKDTARVEGGIERLVSNLIQADILSQKEANRLLNDRLNTKAPGSTVSAGEFVGFVKTHEQMTPTGTAKIRSTLDANLQNRVQNMLDERLGHLRNKDVFNGAVLAVDHSTGEILVWAVAGKNDEDTPGKFYDAVTTPRQPGSALKPFLYMAALEKEWTAATIIEDAPLTESVGNGLHAYQNYSRSFYGNVPVRQALGNSLNIPALKALQYVGAETYLDRLRDFGFQGLGQHPIFYGDGIALGNGEVTLIEMVEAYATIANRGVHRPLTPFLETSSSHAKQIVDPQLASLVGLMLSDPRARELEFGTHSILNFPVQTAVKTGTSSDYRDSWAVGFNHKYTVGIWMGNLDQRPTVGLTGSIGPALLLRSVFAELNKLSEPRPLPVHPGLEKHDLCRKTGLLKAANDQCEPYSEWFLPGTAPRQDEFIDRSAIPIRLRRPVNGLHVAFDPRVPAKSQTMEFHIQGLTDSDQVIWDVDGETFSSLGGTYLWPVARGEHYVEATIMRDNKQIAQIRKTAFLVK